MPRWFDAHIPHVSINLTFLYLKMTQM